MNATTDVQGKFITLEGGEGAGKSTQVARLAAFLRDLGHEVLETREPGGAPGAEAIRALLVSGDPARWTPMTEALLHSAARADHLARGIRPALAAGKWVVCDRFTDSTLAYQGYGHGLGVDRIAALNHLVTEGLKPDLTLILDLPVSAGLDRAGSRNQTKGAGSRNQTKGAGSRNETKGAGIRAGGEDRYERMGHDFHDRLREGFLAIARSEPGRCAVIDAGGDIETVARAIARTVSERLHPGGQ